ncbi:MAG: glycosyltransferase family 2 protein [Anaerolineales bacterium]|nr:glycosyltransferase family 2 protein [Anaerolineales bacterium]
MSSVPLVSVILITWNSAAHLPHCLSALSAQTLRNFEVIVIDNKSVDGSLLQVEKGWTEFQLTLRRLDANLGFAVANNLGAHLARGKWIALLNADAYPEPDWLKQVVQAAEQNPQYTMFSSRQIQHHSPGRLDGAGDSYHISGIAWRRFYNRLAEDYGNQREEVFSACPAAALYSREQFLKAGGFDEDYFSYFEDVDLGFRLRLGGAKCLYVPGAVVRHVGSASTGKRSDFSVYYGYRNMIWTFVKDMPSPYLWIFLPLHIITLLFFFVYLTARGQGSAISRAILHALRGMPKMIQKRRSIQNNKKIRTGELWKVMSTGLLEPYREFIQRNRVK